MAEAQRLSGRPRVLLLGDSIRMNYQDVVRCCLSGEAEVRAPEENCCYALYTLSSVERWVGALGVPDVVHWNNGLHDCCHDPYRVPVQMPVSMYTGNLAYILRKLRAYTDKIVFATTTPTHPGRPFLPDQSSWRKPTLSATTQPQ